MKTQQQEELARQLKAISERVKSAIRMMEAGAYRIDILRHLQATQRALNNVKLELLENHLEHWAATLIQGDDPDQCKRMLKEVPILFKSAENISRQS
jgi:DNA-binding FrmR family transcriptional regulator